MPKYKPRQIIIEAFQVGYDKVPDWFPGRIVMDQAQFYSDSRILMVANKGDFVVKEPNGNITYFNRNEFEKYFEKL